MKRSDILAIIDDFIYELNVTSDECRVESKKILDALEEAGMFPASGKVKDHKYNWYQGPDFDTEYFGNVLYFLDNRVEPSWEPEDD